MQGCQIVHYSVNKLINRIPCEVCIFRESEDGVTTALGAKVSQSSSLLKDEPFRVLLR